MMNIGNKPTIKNIFRTLEVHLLEFNQEIYSKVITIHFVKRIRDEVAFKELGELKQQLKKDRAVISTILGKD